MFLTILGLLFCGSYPHQDGLLFMIPAQPEQSSDAYTH